MFEKLRKIRQDENIKAIEIAEAIGLKTESAYYKKETGKVPFTLEQALIIANMLNKSVEEVFSEDEIS